MITDIFRNKGMLRSLSILIVLALVFTFLVIGPVSSKSCRPVTCKTTTEKVGPSYTETKEKIPSKCRFWDGDEWVQMKIIYERTCQDYQRIKTCYNQAYCSVNKQCEVDLDSEDVTIIREWTRCGGWKRVGFEPV